MQAALCREKGKTMTLFFAILLGVSAFFFTLEPLFRRRVTFASPADDRLLAMYEDLLAEKEGIYAALKEIEFDRDLGKLSQEDYLALKQHYEEKAVAVLRTLDELSPVQDVSEEIEREIAAFRRQSLSASPAHHCPQCGNPYQQGDKFCAHCGHKLPLSN
ncbi:MAG: zinc ribbon domain-containing protein [Nitrospinota bacterium]|nr:MAG: zinc ribbon domain-containing protein [Nitrospinota bacterium]